MRRTRRTLCLLGFAAALLTCTVLGGLAGGPSGAQEGGAERALGEPTTPPLRASPGFEQANATDVEAAAAELVQQAEASETGTVQVIVGLEVPGPDVAPPSPERDAAIADAQGELDQSLAPVDDAELVDTLDSTPVALVEVGPEGIEALAQDPTVSSLMPNVADPVVLDDSAPRVGATGAWSAGFDGSGTAVAVFDSGVDRTHPAFTRSGGANRVVAEACFSQGGIYDPDPLNPGPTYTYTGTCPTGGTPVDNDWPSNDGVEGTGMAAPCTGSAGGTGSGCDHGTHVAGTISSEEPGAGTNDGIAPGADLWAVQVFSDPPAGSGQQTLSFYWDQVGALEYLYEHRTDRNLVAINMSLGGGQYWDDCDVADPDGGGPLTPIDPWRSGWFNQLRAANVALVVASGNNGYTSNISAPACLNAATSVGAVNAGGSPQVMAFSNATPGLDLLAVGDDVTAPIPGTGYATKDGTSMATPHVAAAWAILRQQRPAATVSTLEDRLKATGTPVVDGGNGLTYPLIQIDDAVIAAPDAPLSFTATPGNTEVQLSWAAPGDGGSPITAYRVYMDGVQHGDDLGAGATGTTVTGLTNGVEYDFEVAAVNAAGEGAKTSVQSATPSAVPGAPTDLSAVPGDQQVQLGWTAPANSGDTTIEEYRIYRDGSLVGTTEDGSTTTFLASELVNGTTHGFQVSAVNASGEGLKSTAAAATPRTTPGAPTSVVATPGDEQLGLTWVAPGSDGGDAIDQYRVYVDGELAASTPDGSTLSTTVTGLVNGSDHVVEVAAVNAAGEGARSSSASGVPMPVTATFVDVPFSHPFSRDVEWMVSADVTTGFSDGTYRPTGTVTRAAMSAFMYRLADAPAFTPPATATFTDVPTTHMFFKEIEWLAAEQITTGFPGGLFKPADDVTRQSMSAFMYRLAGTPAFTPPATATFTDVPTTHPFFREIEWMAAEQITTGFPGGLFKPGDKVTRQAMSAFLHRLADGPGVDV